MGTSGSTCAETPLRPPFSNRHLADALDPRSPSVGILRTPIEPLQHTQTNLRQDAVQNGHHTPELQDEEEEHRYKVFADNGYPRKFVHRCRRERQR
ncbi:hypothetical protein chiPu_0032258, partial [Chiloscyllium punctatum]|nr:hypothetical protein [Chiloscyllium punctatum]